jgi:hypothetical protein
MGMKILYCERLDKYVSAYHCEFFNDGKDCVHYSNVRWNRIKDLLRDRKRPKWNIQTVGKPFKCRLLVDASVNDVT